MASRIQGLTVEIGGDTVKLQTALKDVDKQIKSTQAELKDVNRLLKLDPGNTELLSQKQKLLAEAVEGTKSRLDTLKTAYEAAMKDPNYDPKALDAMQREIVETESNLKSLEKQSDQVALQMAKLDGSGTVQSKLNEIDKALSTTHDELEKVEKALKLDPSNTELVAQKQELLKTAVQQTREKVDEMKAAYEQAAKDPNFDKSSLEALEKEIDAAEKELKELEEQAKSSKSTLDKIGEAGEKLQSFGKKATKVGQTVTDKLTTPIVDFGKSAVETTMNFDATMSEVAAIAGATGSDLEDLRAKAKEMGATTKFSASEAAEAMTYMGMAGWDTTQILGGIPGIMNLASASGTDLATTSDIVTDALTALKMEAEDAGHFADVLAAASSGANTNVELLGESFKYVAPLAGTMHYSVEDLAIALGTMANSG
ncbi:MAG: phage tail tape measure protein, partial [Allobaculum sp.]|nr:phage tail tape measure protein [Allobaculum sp.]